MLRRHRAMLLCGLAAFFAYAYFYEAGGWNQNTRFDLVRALVEHGSLRIDEYASGDQDNSGDKALSGGHVYADKAPGAIFLAAPAVALARAGMRLVGADPRSRVNLAWQSYVASLAAAAAPGALAVMCVWYLARHKLGASMKGATVVALAFGLGTPFWAWATIFYGHTLAAFCLLSAFLAAVSLGDGPKERNRDICLGALVGLFVGGAVVTEYTTAIPGTIVTLYALKRASQGAPGRLLRVGAAIGVCGGLLAVALGFYNFATFGSPFHVSYASEENSTVLAHGFFGFTYPHLAIVGQLLWGSYRGLFRLGPVLMLVPIGWLMVRRRDGDRQNVVISAALAFLVGFLFNAGYEWWEGGWSFGPRHLGQVLGFAALALVPVWMRGGRVLRSLTVVLAVAGFAICLVGISTNPQPPSPTFYDPMGQLQWPAFREGQLSLNRQSYFDKRPPDGRRPLEDRGVDDGQWNLGERMGLRGLPSLIPLLVGLGVLVVLGLRAPD